MSANLIPLVPSQLTGLLRQLGEQLQAARQQQPTDYHFNIFRLLRPAHDEVRVHSRFLAELLSPVGSHGQDTLFLKLWAAQLQAHSFFPVDFLFEKATVRREHRYIDILLDDGNYWLILENKIYALDQPRQLTNYYEEALRQKPDRQPVLYYLTLDGHAPAAQSVEGLPVNAPLYLLSYADTVDEWLTSCAAATASQPKLQQAILQYQHLIWHLTGQTMQDEKDIVQHLLEQDDHALQAAALVRNWEHIRHHVEYQFWLALEERVTKYYTVTAEAHFSPNSIHKAIHGLKKRKTGYGLKFKLGSLRGKEVLFKIDRGNGLLTYGLPTNSLPPDIPSEQLLALRYSFPELVTTSSFWLACWPNAEALDFESFRNGPTVRLTNPSNRTAAVNELWTAIQEAAILCATCLHQEFGEEFTSPKLPANV